MDYKATWRLRTREWAVCLLGGLCAWCGVTEGLEFDHVDAATKVVDISAAIRDGWSRDRIETELAKCQLLCKPCNLAKSKEKGEHAGGWNRDLDPHHGSSAMYGRTHKCRCPLCCQWRRDYRKGLVDAQGHKVVVAQ